MGLIIQGRDTIDGQRRSNMLVCELKDWRKWRTGEHKLRDESRCNNEVGSSWLEVATQVWRVQKEGRRKYDIIKVLVP